MKKINVKTDFSFEAEEEGRITGYASVYGVVDSYGEVIEKGAFDNVLNDIKNNFVKMPLMLLNHQHFSGCPAGVWDYLSSDEKGLKISGLLNTSIQSVKDVYSSLKFSAEHGNGEKMGLSIGFYMDWDSFLYDDKKDIGHIYKVLELKEVSIVNFPANEEAVITSVKRDSLINEIKALATKRDFERFLRDVGTLSKREAETFISVFSALNSSKCDTAETLSDLNGYLGLISKLDDIVKR